MNVVDLRAHWESSTQRDLSALRACLRTKKLPITIRRYHIDLLTDDMARMEAVLGRKGMPKLVREAIKEKFGELA